jgi:hypothetical protein
MSRPYLTEDTEAAIGEVTARWALEEPITATPEAVDGHVTDEYPTVAQGHPAPGYGAQEPPQDDPEDAPLFADVSAWRAGGGKPVAPTLLRRDDGAHLFYRGKVSKLIGDAESAKTWIALAACAVELQRPGGRALYVDADHNGIDGIVPRLDILGAPADALSDPDRFRYTEVEDADQYRRVLAAIQDWPPTVTVIDCHAAVAEMHNLNDNDTGDMRRFTRLLLAPYAAGGGAVILIDHLAKNEVSRSHGETGATAKGAAVSGVSYRVDIADSWSEPTGGASRLSIVKDRPSGVRSHCEPVKGRGRPFAGTFRLHPPEEGRVEQAWAIYAPGRDDAPPTDMVGRIDRLPEEQRSSVNAVTEALKVRRKDAADALRKWRDQHPVPGNREPGTAPPEPSP